MNRPGQYSLSYPFETDDPSLGMTHLTSRSERQADDHLPVAYAEAR
jgi:hypothetical protein